jgi:hypothetical protein
MVAAANIGTVPQFSTNRFLPDLPCFKNKEILKHAACQYSCSLQTTARNICQRLSAAQPAKFEKRDLQSQNLHSKSISPNYIRGAGKIRRLSIRQDFSGAISEFWDMH